MATTRKRGKPEMLSRDVEIRSSSLTVRIRAVHAKADEPEIDTQPWLQLKGVLTEPVKGVRDVVISFYPKDRLEVGTARPASCGAIIRARPELQFVITWPEREFDRLWAMVLGKEITATVEKLINDRSAMNRFRPALSGLLLWFRDHPSSARQLFSMLYENKHRLYDDEEILENIKHADDLKHLLNRFKVKSVDELQAVIEQHSSSELLPVTQQIIASLGITSVEDWTKALEDKNLAALFSHESTPTPDMFVFAQSLIQNAKARVKAHLSTLDDYDLSGLDETAPTILAGIKKHNRDVTVVVRPAYDGTVIVYYQSERDVLDYEEHELWVDTGNNVRRITFGHILKKTDIRRFPI